MKCRLETCHPLHKILLMNCNTDKLYWPRINSNQLLENYPVLLSKYLHSKYPVNAYRDIDVVKAVYTGDYITWANQSHFKIKLNEDEVR